jgi:hypothetical protein
LLAILWANAKKWLTKSGWFYCNMGIIDFGTQLVVLPKNSKDKKRRLGCVFCTDLLHETYNTPSFKVQHLSEEAVLDSFIGGSMAYDEDLAERVWQALAGTPGLVEKKMFDGGIYERG